MDRVSVEDAAELARVDELRRVPAAVRFVSAEPLLGPLTNVDLAGVGWLIAGGESGPHYRPVDSRVGPRTSGPVQRAAATAFFFKQWGGRTLKAGGRVLDGREYSEMPTRPIAAAAPANDGWSPAQPLRLPS
jgi:protein gp37